MNQINAVLVSNFFYVVVAFGFIFLIMLLMLILTKMEVSEMRRQYKKMMAGSEGANIENMLSEHAEDTKKIVAEQKRLDDDIDSVKTLLDRAITKVAVVRFDAFDNTSSDLSYCAALLDSKNTGIIISGINGREEARTYAKPIVNGESVHYKLTKEEEQALQEATAPAVSPTRRRLR